MARQVWVDSEGNRYHRHFESSVAVNRASGTKILVVENEDPDSYDEFKWATMCLDHARICHWETLAQAQSHARMPEWCGPCQHIIGHEDTIEECVVENYDCAYDHCDLTTTRTDVNDGVEIGTFYRYELIEHEVLV